MDGNKVWGFHDSTNLRIHHFKEISKECDRENLGEILKIVSYFPIFVNGEENNILYRPMTKEELILVLSTFRRKMPGSCNSTFSVQIPKVDFSNKFDDFRPISPCNFLYKIISKLIVVRIKPLLSNAISFEQFGFLKGRLIHEVRGTA